MRVGKTGWSRFVTPDGAAAPSADALERLHRRYADSHAPRLREALILRHQWLVGSLAVRFLGGSETLEDLIQIGNIGLINALDRYKPGRSIRFSTYATPTILGEIRRHFRDRTGAVRVPRGMQDLRRAAEYAALVMTGELGRAPLPFEVAARLDATEEEILSALGSAAALYPLSLDAPLELPGGDSLTLLDRLGCRDAALEEFERYGRVRDALACLAEREREVVRLRFFGAMSQARIARRLNLSQMHVSRLERQALGHLREMLAEEWVDPAGITTT